MSRNAANPTSPAAQPPPWNPASRIAFKFVFTYVALYALHLADWRIMHAVIPWVGLRVLHMRAPITVFTNGSGDTTYDWVLCVFDLATAAAVTGVWTLIDRNRRSYASLYAWLRFTVRVLLAIILLAYGFDKVIPMQFGPMTLSRLAAPFGSLTLMGVLWAFMAASPGYTIFTGSIEVLAGLLLLVPRLATLGALVAMVALINIFALNVFYDVPVKLFSFHLLLAAFFLALPDLPRLANVLIFNRPTVAENAPRLFRNVWLDRALIGISWAFGAFYVASLIGFIMPRYALNAGEAQRVPFYGIWIVDDFSTSGRNDHLGGKRWERLTFESGSLVRLQTNIGDVETVNVAIDERAHTMLLSGGPNSTWAGRVDYQTPSAQDLALAGTLYNGAHVSAKLHRMDLSQMVLKDSVFQFIHEFPR